VFLPQRYDKEFQDAPDFAKRMFACLMKALENCEVVVAILDGPDADSGTSFEMGYAAGEGRGSSASGPTSGQRGAWGQPDAVECLFRYGHRAKHDCHS